MTVEGMSGLGLQPKMSVEDIDLERLGLQSKLSVGRLGLARQGLFRLHILVLVWGVPRTAVRQGTRVPSTDTFHCNGYGQRDEHPAACRQRVSRAGVPE